MGLGIFVREKKSSVLDRKRKGVVFDILAPEAKTVSLAGDFNQWEQMGIPLKKGRNGQWKTKVSLPSGSYEYKFIIDGQWRIDPNNDQTALNTCGSLNSIKKVAV